MIIVISGTNRPDSMTLKVAKIYQRLLAEQTDNVKLLSLEGRNVWERGEEMIAMEEEFLVPAEKFVFIMPEYNASFPGILKLMMDNSAIKKCWWYKKALLTGVSDGRAGNLRGIEHMTSILHYMKVHVLYDKLLLSKINEEINTDGDILNPATAQAIQTQVDEFLKY